MSGPSDTGPNQFDWLAAFPSPAQAGMARLEGWIDGDARLKWISAGAREMTGYSAAELMGMDRFPDGLVHPDDRPAVADLLAHLLSGGGAGDLRVRLARKDGSIRWVRVSYEAVSDREGNAQGFCATLEEVALPLTPAELARAETEALDTARLETLGRLAQRVAHDCNNLLMVVLGHADLILATTEAPDPKDWASVREDAGQACRATRAAGDLMRHLLDYARAATDQADSFRIDQVLKDMAVLLRIVVPKSIGFTIEGPFPAVSITATLSEVRQLITQLVLTAVDSSRADGSRIVIRLRSEELTEEAAGRFAPAGALGAGPAAVIEVEDSNVTPAAEGSLHPFSPGWTGARGKGLATVLRIARRNRAGVQVDVTPATARFRIGFPAGV